MNAIDLSQPPPDFDGDGAAIFGLDPTAGGVLTDTLSTADTDPSQQFLSNVVFRFSSVSHDFATGGANIVFSNTVTGASTTIALTDFNPFENSGTYLTVTAPAGN